MRAFATADIVDAYREGGGIVSCELQFRQFGKRTSFGGPIRTLATLEDNALLKQLVSGPGNGAVLVVDGAGSLRTALVGDKIAGIAAANGWAGLVLNGAVRDTVMLATIDIGIKALGSNPWTSAKAGTGSVDMPLRFGGATFAPGAWLYSDDDGIIIATAELP